MKQQAATRANPQKDADLCNRPVMTHLSAAEFKALERFSKRNVRSLSSTVRMLVIEGLKLNE